MMQQVSQRDAKQMIAVSLLADRPTLVWGMPGVGKSSFIQQIGERLGYKVHVIIGSLCDPTDLKGLPHLTPDGEVRFARPHFIMDALKEKVLLFFDELTLAPIAVRNAMLRLVLEKALDEVKLPAWTRIIAAANPPDVAEGWDLTSPMANRFVHVWFPESSAEDISTFFSIGNFPSDAEIANRLAEVWDVDQTPYRRKWGNLIGAFLGKVAPAERYRLPKAGSEFPDNLAFPTPRTWEYARDLLAATDIFLGVAPKDYTVTELHSAILSGTLGFGTTKVFVEWVSKLDIPTIDDLLEGKAKMPNREDIQFVIMSLLSETFTDAYAEVKRKSDPKKEKRLKDILLFVTKLHQQRHDLSFLFVSMLNQRLKATVSEMVGMWVFEETRPKFVPAEFIAMAKECAEIMERIKKERH